MAEQPKHGPSATSKIPRHFCRHHDACGKGDGNCNYTTRKDLVYEPDPAAPPPHWNDSYWNHHHVLPVSCLKKFETWNVYKPEERETICAVYDATKWCASRKLNLIKLPRNATIRKQNNVQLPAHNMHHNNIGGYNDKVTTELHLRVWEKAKKAKKNELHPKDGKTELLTDLEKLEEDFKTHLKNRGSMPGGDGDSMVDKLLSRDELVAALELKKGESSWRGPG